MEELTHDPEQDGHRDMEEKTHPHPRVPPEARRNRIEPGGTIKLDIGQGIQDVKAGHPKQDSQTQHQRGQVHSPEDGDPGPNRGTGEAEPEDQVRERGKPFRIRIEDRQADGDG